MDISRKTEVYKVLIEKKIFEKNSVEYKYDELIYPNNVLENLLNYYYTNYIHTSINDKKVKLTSSNICYYMNSVEQKNDVRMVKLNYIKFNKNTTVVDIDSLTAKYKKDKNDGDEEYQHYVIKTFKDTNRAVLVFEKITGAVTITMLKAHLNKAYKEWIKKNYTKEEQQEEKQELLNYAINIKAVPSPDFIEELEKLDKISLLKITVDKEKLTKDEDINFSEENISRPDVDITYKPIQGLSFSKFKMKQYFKLFQEQTGKTRIKRIVISGRKEGNGISLDTEQMKLSKYIKMEVDSEGFVDSKSIFSKYEILINKDCKEYFNNMFIDFDEEESEE